MQLTFTALHDDASSRVWQRLFHQLWPAYRNWYLQDGIEARPTFVSCRRALRRYMPELEAQWLRCCELAGGGDLAARFLSLYCPPAYICNCSQGVWQGDEPLLVRNYDYPMQLFDALVLRSEWGGRAVMGTSDCLIGLVDGCNDYGLCVSLTFGGCRTVGVGFGVPIILRYVLQFCRDAQDAREALCRIPSHMAYNITALDARGEFVTVFLSPGRRPQVVSQAAVTNHQGRVEWHQHAHITASVEREQFLLQKLMRRDIEWQRFIAAFLQPPIYSYAFNRGFGTLYTAAYWPRLGLLNYRWPQVDWPFSLSEFTPSQRNVRYI